MRLLCDLNPDFKKQLDDVSSPLTHEKSLFELLLDLYQAKRLPDTERPSEFRGLETMIVLEVANEVDGDALSLGMASQLPRHVSQSFYDTRYGEPSWAKKYSLGAVEPPAPRKQKPPRP